MARARVAYVASTFPKLTETFILREVREVERAGIPLSTYSIRPRPPAPYHADALPYLDRTHYAPWFGLAHLGAFVSLLVRRPRGVLDGIAFLIQDSVAHARYPAVVMKTLLCTGKMFLFTRSMEREGIVHVHGHFTNVPTTTAAFAARVLGISYSFTGHAWDIFVASNQAGLDTKVAGATFVATCSDFNRQTLSRLVRPGEHDKVVRNYHGLDLAGYAPVEARDADRIVAGGSLVEQKGLVHLVDAAALLRDRGVSFHIEIVGDGPQHQLLRDRIARHQLESSVSLVPSMPHEQLKERMRTAAMVVLPAVRAPSGHMDGIPNILVESLALGVPVVSSRLSGIPELVVDGETGLLAEPGDVEGLARAIESLLRDPARARALGRAGRARVESNFDVHRNVAELVDRFRKILSLAGEN